MHGPGWVWVSLTERGHACGITPSISVNGTLCAYFRLKLAFKTNLKRNHKSTYKMYTLCFCSTRPPTLAKEEQHNLQIVHFGFFSCYLTFTVFLYSNLLKKWHRLNWLCKWQLGVVSLILSTCYNVFWVLHHVCKTSLTLWSGVFRCSTQKVRLDSTPHFRSLHFKYW